MSELFPEPWVRETLLKALPEGVVEHRLPEVLFALRSARPTRCELERALLEPLAIYGVRPGTSGHIALREAMALRIETFGPGPNGWVADDRPDTIEWLKTHTPDWTRDSKVYWKDFFVRADRDSRLPSLRARTFVMSRYEDRHRLPPDLLSTPVTTPAEWVRRVRYIERGVARGNFPEVFEFDPVRMYGAVVGAGIRREFEKLTADLDCVDNRRVAEVGNKKHMSQYRYQQRNGCCGSTDTTVVVEGRTFAIGCNYGH